MGIWGVPTVCGYSETSLPWAWSSHYFHRRKWSFVQGHSTGQGCHWGPNSLLGTMDCRWCYRTPLWSYHVSDSASASAKEYFSYIMESEGRGLARADTLGLSQDDPLPQSQPSTPKRIQNISPECSVRVDDCSPQQPNGIIIVTPGGSDDFQVVCDF